MGKSPRDESFRDLWGEQPSKGEMFSKVSYANTIDDNIPRDRFGFIS